MKACRSSTHSFLAFPYVWLGCIVIRWLGGRQAGRQADCQRLLGAGRASCSPSVRPPACPTALPDTRHLRHTTHPVRQPPILPRSPPSHPPTPPHQPITSIHPAAHAVRPSTEEAHLHLLTHPPTHSPTDEPTKRPGCRPTERPNERLSDRPAERGNERAGSGTTRKCLESNLGG